RARYLLASSYQQDGAWAEAAAIWQRILAEQREAPEERGRILYWLGLCYRNLRKTVDAASAWEQAVPLGGDEGRAAALRLAEVRIETGKQASGLELYERVLAPIAKPEEYRNSLVDLAQVQNLLKSSCGHCLAGGNFEVAEKLARFHAQLTPGGPAQLL